MIYLLLAYVLFCGVVAFVAADGVLERWPSAFVFTAALVVPTVGAFFVGFMWLVMKGMGAL